MSDQIQQSNTEVNPSALETSTDVDQIEASQAESTEVKQVGESTRLFPDNFHQWNGENIVITASYSDYFKDSYPVKKFEDVLTKKRDDFTYLVSHLPGLIDKAKLQNIEKLSQNTDIGRLWRQSVKLGVQSIDHSSAKFGTQGVHRQNRPNSQFESTIQTESGARIGLSIPKIADSDAPVLSGTAALFRMQSMLGRGPTIQIPLVHSGFWVSLKAPTNEVLINLYEMIGQEKINLGRNTHGFVFSAMSAYTARIILQILEDHLHDSTLVVEAGQSVLQHIKLPDLDLLLIGWARTIWPTGFNLIRPELTEEGAATSKMVAGKVDLAKMVWYDTTFLTPWQKSHMAQRGSNSMKLEAIQRYQKELPVWTGRDIVIKQGIDEAGRDSVSLKLAVPTVDQYLTSSQRWVDGVVELVESTLTTEGSEELKNSKIGIQSRANIARQYAHWIEKISLGNQEVVDAETIDQMLDLLASEESFNETFYEAIGEYREDIAVSLVGIPEPNFKEISPGKHFARIIPIDPLSHFFNLLASRAMKISPR